MKVRGDDNNGGALSSTQLYRIMFAFVADLFNSDVVSEQLLVNIGVAKIQRRRFFNAVAVERATSKGSTIPASDDGTHV